MLTNILSRWDDILKLKSGDMVLPRFVDFQTSNKCNQHCLGCAYNGLLTGEAMDRAKHFELVDMFIDLGVKAFDFCGGGEPATLPYLADILRHVTARGAHFGIITNGTLLNDDLIDAIIAGGSYVRVSLEASCEDDYRRYKRSESWPAAFGNLKKLVECKFDMMATCDISIRVSAAKALRGWEHYERAIDLGQRLGLDRVTIKPIRGGAQELTESELRDEAEILRAVIRGMRAEDLVRESLTSVGDRSVPQCWLNPLHTVVDHHGTMYLCCYYYERPERHHLGNLFKSPFKELWFGQGHADKIRSIDRGVCARYDCKFFGHHAAVENGLERGKVYFL